MKAALTPGCPASRSVSTGSGPYVAASRSVRGRLTGVPVAARSRRTLPRRLSAANPAATRRDASEPPR